MGSPVLDHLVQISPHAGPLLDWHVPLMPPGTGWQGKTWFRISMYFHVRVDGISGHTIASSGVGISPGYQKPVQAVPGDCGYYLHAYQLFLYHPVTNEVTVELCVFSAFSCLKTSFKVSVTHSLSGKKCHYQIEITKSELFCVGLLMWFSTENRNYCFAATHTPNTRRTGSRKPAEIALQLLLP
ncbi:hypothetical protein BHM03_00010052, partial [Ensete ventricosum]